MDLSIYTECNVDTNLVETLVPPKSGYNHQYGCNNVARAMKVRMADKFAIGIIDRDKEELDYLKEFDIAIESDALILHRHKSRHHYIIQISPAAERFILNAAEKVGVSLDEYNLSNTLEGLKEITKTVRSKNEPRLKKLFKTLQNKKAPEIVQLTNWITYLKEKQYAVDLKVLKSL